MIIHFKVEEKEMTGSFGGICRFGCGKNRELSPDGFYFLNESFLKGVGRMERRGEMFKD